MPDAFIGVTDMRRSSALILPRSLQGAVTPLGTRLEPDGPSRLCDGLDQNRLARCRRYHLVQSLDNASIVRELLSFHQPHFEGGHGEGRGAAQHGEDAAYA